MEFGNMMKELKSTCSSMEKQKKDLLKQVQSIDEKLTCYKAALDNLIKAGCTMDQDDKQAPKTHSTRAVMYTHNGVTKSLTGWSKQTGINVKTLWYRLNKGWSLDKTLNTPAGNYGRHTQKNQRARPHKVFAYDMHGNVVRQFVGVGDASRSLNMPVTTIEKLIEHVPKEDQLRVRQYYLAYAG